MQASRRTSSECPRRAVPPLPRVSAAGGARLRSAGASRARRKVSATRRRLPEGDPPEHRSRPSPVFARPHTCTVPAPPPRPEPAPHAINSPARSSQAGLGLGQDERARRTDTGPRRGRRGASRAGACAAGSGGSAPSDASRTQIFQRVEEESKRRALAAEEADARAASRLSQTIPEETATHISGSATPSPVAPAAATSARPVVGERRRGSVSVSRFGQVRGHRSDVP